MAKIAFAIDGILIHRLGAFTVWALILDELLDGLRGVCSTFPDKRKGGDAVYSMADIGLAGLAPFFM